MYINGEKEQLLQLVLYSYCLLLLELYCIELLYVLQMIPHTHSAY